ncbi:MAG: glutamine-hydrolyzing carbamoyl-phosphate synthase small subunit [Polyangia bacterium]
MKARLVLEDGTIFPGESFGATTPKLASLLVSDAVGAGEVVFNTALSGYEEILSDPSYRGQIVAMTAPQIGNTGWNREDLESARLHLAGFVVRELSPQASSWRSEGGLHEALVAAGVPGISGVDTRLLTRILRDGGAQRGLISSDEAASDDELVAFVRRTPTLDGRDLVREVTCQAAYDFSEPSWRHPDEGAVPVTPRFNVVAYDFGLKRNILRRLVDLGCRVRVVPATTPGEAALATKFSDDRGPDGVFFSNGPGDPAVVTYGVDACRKVLESGTPFFGICLGHQLLGLALGGGTYKLKFGHHGANQPVMDLGTRRVEITSQNHGFAVDVESLRGKAELSHVNLQDGTVEGIRVTSARAFSVQYHPEAAPGPHDARYLFDRFVDLMQRGPG